MTSRGRFITLEGVDGAARAPTPAGSPISCARRAWKWSPRVSPAARRWAKLRALVLNDPMGLDTETLLMFAARCEHARQVIEPALARGAWVVCDRYTDASYAYQGGGRGLGAERVAALEAWMQAGQPTAPGCSTCRWKWRVSAPRARTRPFRARGRGNFFERTRAAYHDRAKADPDRIRLIDSTRSISEIRAELEAGLLA